MTNCIPYIMMYNTWFVPVLKLYFITTYNTFTSIYHCIVTKHLHYYIVKRDSLCDIETGQVGLVV